MASHGRPEPTPGCSRKRKEPSIAEPSSDPALAAAGNRLLAGYLAHEFLTRGTLLGQRWDWGLARPGPGPTREPEPVPEPEPAKGCSAEPAPAKPPRAYADVARLLKAEGVHIPGVVNPTQLARWLQS